MRIAVGVSLALTGCTFVAGSMKYQEPDAGATADDGSTSDDAATAATSRCTVTPAQIDCTYETTALDVGLLSRDVHYQVPMGTPPAGGWPTVVYYQGSFVSAENAFTAKATDTFGAYHLSLTLHNLLEAGFAVIAPEALGNGSTAWGTNVPPASTLWEGSADDRLVDALLVAIGDGTFGPLDASKLYAMGISSGGFMTSRMAVSYAGHFRSLAIHSGSYATCSTLCFMPSTLPADHPPTLFLLGQDDPVVPVNTVTAYRDQLMAEGHVASSTITPGKGHEWLPAAATAIRDWFIAHP